MTKTVAVVQMQNADADVEQLLTICELGTGCRRRAVEGAIRAMIALNLVYF